jgi:hypothetical protein
MSQMGKREGGEGEWKERKRGVGRKRERVGKGE